MIARRQLPVEFAAWNREQGAPFGRSTFLPRRLVEALPERGRAHLQGPFSFQSNNTTRAFEYPWALAAAGVKSGQRVLEIGGGLSGFQFALDRLGSHVVNVDPGLEAAGRGWPCNPHHMAKLN